jgi:hypothetical protein
MFELNDQDRTSILDVIVDELGILNKSSKEKIISKLEFQVVRIACKRFLDTFDDRLKTLLGGVKLPDKINSSPDSNNDKLLVEVNNIKEELEIFNKKLDIIRESIEKLERSKENIRPKEMTRIPIIAPKKTEYIKRDMEQERASKEVNPVNVIEKYLSMKFTELVQKAKEMEIEIPPRTKKDALAMMIIERECDGIRITD